MKRKTFAKLAALLLSLLMLLSLFPAAALALEPGDMDGDAKVTAKDARFVLRLSARLETASDAQKAAADADEDGKVTAKDARIILRVSAKLTTFEHEQAVAQKRKQLEALGPEANLYLFSDVIYYDGEAYIAELQEHAEIVIASDGTNSYESYHLYDNEEARFGYLYIDGKTYFLEPESKVCVELNRKNAEILGLAYDDEDVPAEPAADPDIERFDIRTEDYVQGGLRRKRTTITHPELANVITIHTEADGTLLSVVVSDRETDATVTSIEIWDISETIPDGLLDLGSYHVCADAYDFLRRFG